jgi:L-lactate dehydrogenase (cytochrome)
MSFDINTDYPSIAHLKKRTEQRMPKFAYEYLTEGCNDDINVKKKHYRYSQNRTNAILFR